MNMDVSFPSPQWGIGGGKMTVITADEFRSP